MTVEDSIKFFEDEFKKYLEIIDWFPKDVANENKENIINKAVHIENAIFALKSLYGAEKEKPIEWGQIKDFKGLPVYIKEKQIYSNEWFGWWDIVDTVKGDTVITAYSESFIKQDKGKKWEIYFKKIQ